MSSTIGLGVLQLRYDNGRDPSHTDWLQSYDFLLQVSSSSWANSSTNLVALLKDLLADEALGITLSWKDIGSICLVRVSIVPLDAEGSRWSASSGNKAVRGKNLQKLFGYLEDGWDEGGEKLMKVTVEEINLDMPTLYANIESPPEPYESLYSAGGIDPELAYTLQSYESPKGISAVLKPYQIRSVSRMLAMETEPDSIQDPRYTALPRQDGVGKEEEYYYLDTRTYEIVSTVQRRSFPRGGILCEEMGSGKTCMMLTLLVATLQQPCRPPPNHTYLYPKYKADNRLPTLVELCTSVITKAYPEMNLSKELPHLDLDQEQHRGLPRFLQWTHSETVRAMLLRDVAESKKEMSLINASLVIVPAILVNQWQEEIKKHVHAGVLKVLLLAIKENMPSLETMAEYDMILMDVEVLKREARVEHSILLKARWKRIVLDEGSTASAKTTWSNIFACQLSVERRWLISGTPTRNLKQGTDGAMLEDSKLDQDIEIFASPTRRQWSQADRDDATRIGTMIDGFLHGDIFKGLSTNFQHSITNPLVHKSGPGFGAVARMKELLGCIMVKHRSSDINKDVHLPPLSIATVRLSFDPLQRITYNVMVAYILANLIMRKKASPYNILHVRNGETDQIVKHLRIACTWYTGDAGEIEDRITGIQAWMDDSDNFLGPKKNGERLPFPIAEQDAIKNQLRVILGYLEEARDDEVWMGINAQVTGSVLFDVDLTEELVGAWSECGGEEMGGRLLSGPALVLLRKYNWHGTGIDELVERGAKFREIKYGALIGKWEKERKLAVSKAKNSVKGRGKGKGKAKAKGTIKAVARPVAPITHTNAVASGSNVIVREEEEGEGEREVGEDGEQKKKKPTGPPPSKQDIKLLDRPRPMLEEIQTFSRSAKINWVLKTLNGADAEDKFIIFGSSAEVQAVGEVLALADIKASSFIKSVTKVKRESGLRDFEGPRVRVCLMELGLAAQGLTLIMANRMIILSPVWNPDVQAQAIKRIHRIGQTRRCKVEILVMEGTVEEIIAGRRPGSQDEESSYTRSLIERAKFVVKEELPNERFSFRFKPVEVECKTPVKGMKRKRVAEEEEAEDGSGSEIEDRSPAKKKRKSRAKAKEKERGDDGAKAAKQGKAKGKGKGKAKDQLEEQGEDDEDEGVIEASDDVSAATRTVQAKSKSGTKSKGKSGGKAPTKSTKKAK